MDRQIAHPDVRTPIRAWWEGHYTHVFLALYPFFKIRSEGLTGGQTGHYEPVFEWEERPDDFDEITKLRGEPITWCKMHKTIAPDCSKKKFYRAAGLAAALGFPIARANIPLQEKIFDYCEANEIYLPERDCIPAILHPRIRDFLRPFEGRKIVAYEEFRMHSVELTLASFSPDVPEAVVPIRPGCADGLWAIHLADPGILLTSRYGGIEMLIAMTDAAVAQSDPRLFFETEPVDDGMYCDWYNPKGFFEREK